MTTEPATQPAPRQHETIPLSEPIRRGEHEIAELGLRKPRAGELRGLSLQDVITSDITALLTLIPRISNPPLTPDEANALEPEDLAAIGGTVRGFFMTRAEREIMEMMIAEQRPKT
ncbi:phage tail assembly protein [Alteraurantiacibacter buctensis]|uniref:Phage tail assembly protein n=1 Tax=Alteraurantiacibacter buctensis TaxID=1503981 RepID=A0A844Z3S7_9SPHN|nr:phage tail assembly protein [Alteraurantiacibacter buctensis]MXO73601.1 phage tail assembly protein [Alteraurantiacibacter buctensis]